jgi:hypothetical protein
MLLFSVFSSLNRFVQIKILGRKKKIDPAEAFLKKDLLIDTT